MTRSLYRIRENGSTFTSRETAIAYARGYVARLSGRAPEALSVGFEHEDRHAPAGTKGTTIVTAGIPRTISLTTPAHVHIDRT